MPPSGQSLLQTSLLIVIIVPFDCNRGVETEMMFVMLIIIVRNMLRIGRDGAISQLDVALRFPYCGVGERMPKTSTDTCCC